MRDRKCMFTVASFVTFAQIALIISTRVVCYWSISSLHRIEPARFGFGEVQEYLANNRCTHLIVGFIDINYMINSSMLDIAGILHAEEIQALVDTGKKIYLGIGRDIIWPSLSKEQDYLNLIENGDLKDHFINEISKVVELYHFDGIDLSWPFPTYEELLSDSENQRSASMEFRNPRTRGPPTFRFHMFRDVPIPYRGVRSGRLYDVRAFFTKFIYALANHLHSCRKRLTLSVLPGSDIAFFDVPRLSPFLEMVHLLTFDYRIPQNTPSVADFTAPLFPDARDISVGVDITLREWMRRGLPAYKTVIGIATFARTWRVEWAEWDGLRRDNPPYRSAGPGLPGALRIDGILSWPEVCIRHTEIVSDDVYFMRNPSIRATIPGKGTYQWGLLHPYGASMMAFYDDPTVIEYKVRYAKERRLEGVAIYEISLDDFQGICFQSSLCDVVTQALA